MRNKIKWILNRPRVLFRAGRILGFWTMLQLVRIRLTGTAQRRYVLRIKGYPHPVFIRGGQSSDAVALYEVLVTQEYAISATLDSPAFIIDGGANVGMASLYFLNRYPAARVVAVEPDDANLEVCRMNLAPYGNRVTLIHGAIWKCAGRLALEAGQQEWVNRVRDDQSGSVEAFTLGSLIAPGGGRVDLLKLDIEGSELEVFGPDAQEWLPGVRNIAIELHGEDRKDRFFAALKGYRYDLSLHRTWTDPDAGSSMSCYLAICQNLRDEAAASAAPDGGGMQGSPGAALLS
jgi:FkbM family methyltransferase